MSTNKSQRITQALQTLQQFRLFATPSADFAFHVLSGVQITARTGPQGDGGLIGIKFPGGTEFDIDGLLYLKLQIAESAAHEVHLDTTSDNPIAVRSSEQFENFATAYEL
jgi:hypothetical protein